MNQEDGDTSPHIFGENGNLGFYKSNEEAAYAFNMSRTIAGKLIYAIEIEIERKKRLEAKKRNEEEMRNIQQRREEGGVLESSITSVAVNIDEDDGVVDMMEATM
eukprot:Tbor_TRINITY_DN8725_c0_g1::TRINITY_DN8725_c0_g1_i1::g.5840::m.5840